jgi:hypothetical protein
MYFSDHFGNVFVLQVNSSLYHAAEACLHAFPVTFPSRRPSHATSRARRRVERPFRSLTRRLREKTYSANPLVRYAVGFLAPMDSRGVQYVTLLKSPCLLRRGGGLVEPRGAALFEVVSRIFNPTAENSSLLLGTTSLQSGRTRAPLQCRWSSHTKVVPVVLGIQGARTCTMRENGLVWSFFYDTYFFHLYSKKLLGPL